ncbi:hypothetical protein ABZX62_04880 [Streptomyces flavidovirens]|uniref:Sigma-70 family RNA polymerase sigma factor n=1 Tax=Streptomyces flavidovirens TaxID=67298 RepID=A0ABW6RH95_9ACTN
MRIRDDLRDTAARDTDYARPRTGAGVHRVGRNPFAAFRELYEPLYLRYALTRLLDAEAAREAVELTFRIAASRWNGLLQSPSPAADVWEQLRAQVSSAGHRATNLDRAVEGLYDYCTVLAADAVVLRCHLGMPVNTAADLMGVDPAAVAAALLTACRALPPAVIKRLGVTSIGS